LAELEHLLSIEGALRYTYRIVFITTMQGVHLPRCGDLAIQRYRPAPGHAAWC
jgi:hypothetical protein